jgi:3-mercaptopyruvate sulfurtransferase SseA
MRLIISFLAIAVMALGVLTACNSAEWKNARTSPVATASPGAPAPPVVADGARRVTVSELKDLLAKNEAIVLDVRNQTSYDAGHIRGARLIPETEVVSHASELPRDKLIVTYCS